ncbi:hypothetical protein [Mycobacterium sp. EPa45]|uniref:hypothetical protein n=1 Tax=Mycobacterium sp. EPa45 TaxID=1545728 RepID=UPI0006421A7C|nr:hypothetical protein [Mycobacterium sp. EPa45]AKK29489.1 hypothetical protein AB431_25595 [Mycobacterium sp. EPa45]
MPPPDRPATVWSSTFVPSKSPLAGFGTDGYSVAWVDTPAGRLQVLVDGDRPEPGTEGNIVNRRLDDEQVEMFVAGTS